MLTQLYARTQFSFIRACGLLLVLFIANAYFGAAEGSQKFPVANKFARVAVINNFTFHDETYASVLYTLSQFNLSRTVLFRDGEGGGIDPVMEPWFTGPVLGVEKFKAVYCSFDVIIFSTFPDDVYVNVTLRKKCDRPQTIIGIVHNPSRFLDERFRSLLPKFNPYLFTVSPHTALYLRTILKRNEIQDCCTVDFFVRIFPYYPRRWKTQASLRNGLVVQGKVDMERRNYTKLFDSLREVALAGDNPLFPITLLGKRKVDSQGVPVVPIPEDVQERGILKVINEGWDPIPYFEYYDIMSQSIAILPCFSDTRFSYLAEKSSSTIPASLITLTPLLADEDLLHAYSFMREDTVIRVASDNFEDIQQAIANSNITSVIHNLRRLRDVLMAKNVKKFKKIFLSQEELDVEMTEH